MLQETEERGKLTHYIEEYRLRFLLAFDVKSLTGIVSSVFLANFLKNEALVRNDLSVARSGVDLLILKCERKKSDAVAA